MVFLLFSFVSLMRDGVTPEREKPVLFGQAVPHAGRFVYFKEFLARVLFGLWDFDLENRFLRKRVKLRLRRLGSS